MKGVTPYQLEILQAVGSTAADAGPIDFDQLLAKLSWKPKKESAQFTIRACITKDLMEKTELQLRRGRLRVCYQLTEKGRLVLDPRSATVSTESGSVVPGRSSGSSISVPGVDLEPISDPEIFDPGVLIE